MTVNGLVVCVPLLLIAFCILGWMKARARARAAEIALADLATTISSLRHREAIHVLSRSGLRRRTLRLDDMTPDEFRKALEEIEAESV